MKSCRGFSAGKPIERLLLLSVLCMFGLQVGLAGCRGQLPTEPMDEELILELWDFRRPWSGTDSYERELSKLIKVFCHNNPGLKVIWRLFEWDEKDEVQALLKQSSLVPDLLSAGPLEETIFIDGVFVAEADLVLQMQLDYYPLADPGRRSVPVAACPRFISPRLFMANTDLLEEAGLEVGRLMEQGIGWCDLLAIGQAVKKLSPAYRCLAATDWPGLEKMVGCLETGSADHDLSFPLPSAGEGRLEQMYQADYISGPVAHEGLDGVEDFIWGRTALLGPAEPWLLRCFADRAARSGVGLGHQAQPFPVVLIAARMDFAGSLASARVENLAVRAQENPERVRAATDLARCLVTNGALCAGLDLLPTCREAQSQWLSAWSLGSEDSLIAVLEAVEGSGGAQAVKADWAGAVVRPAADDFTPAEG